jgi:hypothetical protein
MILEVDPDAQSVSGIFGGGFCLEWFAHYVSEPDVKKSVCQFLAVV